jgi:hypothetical protein
MWFFRLSRLSSAKYDLQFVTISIPFRRSPALSILCYTPHIHLVFCCFPLMLFMLVFASTLSVPHEERNLEV